MDAKQIIIQFKNVKTLLTVISDWMNHTQNNSQWVNNK